MVYNLSYDYASLLLLGMLLFFYFYTPKYKSFQNILFGVILTISFLSCGLDAYSSAVAMVKYADCIWLNNIILMLYQLMQHSLPFLYFVYLMIIIHGDEHVIEVFKKQYYASFYPVAFIELMNLLSPITHLAFRYDETGYHRTWFYFASSASMVFYIVACLVLVIRYNKETGFLPKMSVITYTVMTILFTYIQYIKPEQLLICSGVTISVFTMYMALQSPSLLKEALEDAESSKKAAIEANEAKSAFLANMSHEIRTPMNAICGMTYLLEATDLQKDAKEYVNTIQVASENLLTLINDILDFSKVDSGRMTIMETEYSIVDLVKDVNGMLLGQIDCSKVAPTLYVGPEVPQILRGDVTKVKQIIFNLVSNAVKFTESGQISLHITAQDKGNGKINLSIKVKDTGIGIKDEDREKIFAQFQQIDMAKNRRKEGTGLGLSLVKSFCELMNGHVEVESVYGSGSTFTAIVEQEAVEYFSDKYRIVLDNTVFLVYADNPFVKRSIERTLRSLEATYVVEDKVSAEAVNKFPGMRYCIVYDYEQYGLSVDHTFFKPDEKIMKIALIPFDSRIPDDGDGIIFDRNPFSLFTIMDNIDVSGSSDADRKNLPIFFKPETRVVIVDDNKVNLKVTSAILKKFGINSEMMLSGFDILEALDKGNEYDLIFMDHMMPDLDGVETVKRIRALKKGNCNKVPIVALTANAIKGVEKEFYDAGMNGALFKPINVEDLKETLIKWLPRSLRATESEEKEGKE